jgi:hypothetical protein
LISQGAHHLCPVSECPQYDWLSVNIVQGVLLVFLVYITGFVAREVVMLALVGGIP